MKRQAIGSTTITSNIHGVLWDYITEYYYSSFGWDLLMTPLSFYGVHELGPNSFIIYFENQHECIHHGAGWIGFLSSERKLDRNTVKFFHLMVFNGSKFSKIMVIFQTNDHSCGRFDIQATYENAVEKKKKPTMVKVQNTCTLATCSR